MSPKRSRGKSSAAEERREEPNLVGVTSSAASGNQSAPAEPESEGGERRLPWRGTAV